MPLPDGPLERPTAATLADLDDLRRDGERTRRRGWAVTADELEVGLTGVAVPVRGHRGEVVAALGISGPTATTGGPARRARPVLTHHAAALTSCCAAAPAQEGVA